MDLNILWFILVAVLYIVFFLLEGFDFGVGILLPFIGKTDTRRRAMINTIGPHWDGNEVWLLTAGGATFAAFPQWYATLFSGFYLPLFLLLMALIVRGVAFEFRSKDDSPRWRALWDGCIFAGSLLAPLLLGVAFVNLWAGVPVDANFQYAGGFFNLLNPFALMGGIMTVAMFTLHGAVFLSLKTSGDLLEAVQAAARKLWLPVVAIVLAFLIWADIAIVFPRVGLNPGAVAFGVIITLLASGYFVRKNLSVWAFLMTSLTIILALVVLFSTMFPNVMLSSLNPEWSLTIYNAASSELTLRIMSVVALILVPIVLAYQAWNYWIFRRRVEEKPETLTY
jgi:cytochrome d ubiquinol oxidase subunit II